ncbi:MAG: hypothetical protein ACRDIV_22285 [Ktedonobacteraceae bacterium]
MPSSQDITKEIQQRLHVFNEKLEHRVRALFNEEVLTSNDKAKLEHLAKAIASALSRAMINSYTPVVKEELLTNLVKEYEQDALALLQEVELRRYTDHFLSLRIDRIKQVALSKLRSSEMKKETESQVKQLEKQLWNDMRGISKNVSRRPQLLDVLLHEFERDISSLLRVRISSGEGE